MTASAVIHQLIAGMIHQLMADMIQQLRVALIHPAGPSKCSPAPPRQASAITTFVDLSTSCVIQENVTKIWKFYI